MAALELNAQDLVSQFTVKVNIKGMTRWRWQLQIAKWLIALALYISGMGLEFVDDKIVFDGRSPE